MTTTYHLRPVSAMTRSSSPTASTSTASDRSPPPLGAHHPPSKAMLPPATTNFSPQPINSRPRRPLSPSSLRDIDIPLDPERAFASRGKFPPPPTGPTSGFFEREERKFFAQAGKEIVRLRLEVDLQHHHGPVVLGGATSSFSPTSGPGVPSPRTHHLHPRAPSRSHVPHPQHPHPHASAHTALPPPPPPLPPSHSTSPRSHVPPATFPPIPSQQGPPPPTSGPAHPGYPVSRPPELERAPPPPPISQGPPGDAMAVDEDDDEAWRRPTPHNARRRAGKHTRRVIVK
ncbi:hypothetical protein C8Q74DRAFT_1451806 [Fomes fomentarius]|nr:hypothetical protein C8Q74DRAFT_1451806 [Fomes fomentarius]